MLYSSNPGTVHDLAVDPRGNYAADTLLHVLSLHTGLHCKRWTSSSQLSCKIILVGNGQHWLAITQDKENKWYLHEKHAKQAVQNLNVLLTNRSKSGAVYELVEDTPAQSSANSILGKHPRDNSPEPASRTKQKTI